MRILWLALAIPCLSFGHELTPTYPEMRPAYLDGLLVTSMSMFNARQDVDYYEVGVFSEDWKRVPFASSSKLFHVEHGERVDFDIYIRVVDRDRAFYICTTSKLLAEPERSNAVISSKVCSRIAK